MTPGATPPPQVNSYPTTGTGGTVTETPGNQVNIYGGHGTPPADPGGGTITAATDDPSGSQPPQVAAAPAPAGPPGGGATPGPSVVLPTGAAQGIVQSTGENGGVSLTFPPGTTLNNVNGDQHNWYPAQGGSPTDVPNGTNGYHAQSGGGLQNVHHWPDGSSTYGSSEPAGTTDLINHITGFSRPNINVSGSTHNNVGGNQHNFFPPGQLPAPHISNVGGTVYNHYTHDSMPDPAYRE